MTPADILETYQRVSEIEIVNTVIGTTAFPWVVDAVLAIEFNSPLPNWRQAVYLVDEIERPLPPAWYAHPKLEQGAHIFTGRGATERFVRFFIDHDMRPVPGIAFLASRQVHDGLRGVLLRRRRELERYMAIIEARDTPARLQEAWSALNRAHLVRPRDDERIDVWVDPCCT